jgi:hypothetical protein
VTEADERLLASAGRAAEAAALAARNPVQLDPLQQMMGLPGPVWLNASGERLPDGVCVFISGTARCQHKATHWAWIGCTVGEHLDKSGLCERHARDVLGYPALHCQRCWNAMRIISDARFIRIEEMDDDDAEAADRRLVG